MAAGKGDQAEGHGPLCMATMKCVTCMQREHTIMRLHAGLHGSGSPVQSQESLSVKSKYVFYRNFVFSDLMNKVEHLQTFGITQLDGFFSRV